MPRYSAEDGINGIDSTNVSIGVTTCRIYNGRIDRRIGATGSHDAIVGTRYLHVLAVAQRPG